MKKLIILLALAFVMCGCQQYIIEGYDVVEKIELKETHFIEGYNTKYVVTLSGESNGWWIKNVILYTNYKYSIGDTIQITKKTNL